MLATPDFKLRQQFTNPISINWSNKDKRRDFCNQNINYLYRKILVCDIIFYVGKIIVIQFGCDEHYISISRKKLSVFAYLISVK